ncbi:unnamed protein product [Gordionus sp. m RMFG-2023]
MNDNQKCVLRGSQCVMNYFRNLKSHIVAAVLKLDGEKVIGLGLTVAHYRSQASSRHAIFFVRDSPELNKLPDSLEIVISSYCCRENNL